MNSSTQCRTTLSMLSSHPEICAHIRKLGVRPNYYLAWPKTDKVLDEDWVVLTIAKMAKHLLSLNAFEWSGNEIPRDLLWSSLREHFSLTVRYGLTEAGWINPSENLPQTFWDMLIKRSPDLEELVICSLSSSTRKFEFAPITEARWPKLHTLTLGSFGYTEDFSLGIAEDASFTRFFGSPYDLQMELAPAALPNIKSFSGIYQHLAKLPNIHDIHTLDLTCEPIPKHRLSTHICPLLASLTSLTTLDIWAIPSCMSL
ncbi:hypothetical protein H0H93_001306 [Arthromyces matolae]|nr:hypothetical protein H0H93_001306 [Arthromyces matolae]